MFRNILVISDNVFIAREFEKIIDEHDFSESTFTFGISPFSSISDFEKSLSSEVSVFDLKRSQDVIDIVEKHDLVFSIHCKQIFPEYLVRNVRCINVHPGYNPINRGWYPQVFAIINKLPIGATIHEIDEKLDHGNIIARDYVPVNNFDTSLDVYNRVLKKEIELLNIHFENIINNNYESFAPENEGNVFLKKDFNELLKLDLTEEGTFGAFIDKLRALSHGEYKNAYFNDPETGKKIYVSLNLVPEDEK